MALNHTETTDKKHALVACLPLQATGFTSTSRVSPLHSGLFHHFKFLQQSECSPLRSDPWHQIFWRITHTNLQQDGESLLQGPPSTLTMLLFLPLVVQGRENYSISISTYYEPFTQRINRRKTYCSMNVTWSKYLMIDGNVWEECWTLSRSIIFTLTDPNAFQSRPVWKQRLLC